MTQVLFRRVRCRPVQYQRVRYQRAGGNDPGFVIGSAATCWVVWNISTVPGFLLGTAADPYRFGLDMVILALRRQA